MEGTQKKEGENPAERKGERVAWMDGGEVWIQGPPPTPLQGLFLAIPCSFASLRFRQKFTGCVVCVTAEI